MDENSREADANNGSVDAIINNNSNTVQGVYFDDDCGAEYTNA